MKKFLAIIAAAVALAMSLALTACGEDEETEENKETSVAGKTYVYSSAEITDFADGVTEEERQQLVEEIENTDEEMGGTLIYFNDSGEFVIPAVVKFNDGSVTITSMCIYGSYTQDEDALSCYVNDELMIFTVEDDAVSVCGDIEEDGEYYFTYKYVFELCTQELNVMTPTEWDEYWEETAQATSYTFTFTYDDYEHEYTWVVQVDLISSTIGYANDTDYTYYNATNSTVTDYYIDEDGWKKYTESVEGLEFDDVIEEESLFMSLSALCSTLTGKYGDFTFDANTNSYTSREWNLYDLGSWGYSNSILTITFEGDCLEFNFAGDIGLNVTVSGINSSSVTIPQEVIDGAAEEPDNE